MSFIGIDIGSSFIKGAILDPDNLSLRHVVRIPFPDRIDLVNPLLYEFTPATIVSCARKLIEQLMETIKACEGILVCSQMHGMVLADGKGETHSNFIAWTDHRGEMQHPSYPGRYIDEIFSRIGPEKRRQLGNELNMERPACFLYWLREKGQLRLDSFPLSIADYVVYKLCNSISIPVTDMTNASATGFFNLQTSTWDLDVLTTLGLRELSLPMLSTHGDVVGHYPSNGNLVPIYTPIGDFQCALLGALTNKTELSINVSTGAQVSRITDQLHVGNHQTRPFVEGTFINTFSDAPGGRSFEQLSQLLLERTPSDANGDHWARIIVALEGVPNTDLEVDLWANNIPGNVRNMRADNTNLGGILRGALKGMARSYNSYATQLWEERAWTDIVLSGGFASKIVAIRDTIQQEFRSGYRLSPLPEDTLLGLLILSRSFSGRTQSVLSDVDTLRDRLLNKLPNHRHPVQAIASLDKEL